MGKPFRVIDTGVLEGRLNIAIGQAIVEAHRAGSVPDTLRFLRFPPTALVGRHQALGTLSVGAEDSLGAAVLMVMSEDMDVVGNQGG